LSLLVRTWNVYHGRTHPVTRQTHLQRMIELVTADKPDLVALQEVPLWSLGKLDDWTGMAVRWAVTVPAILLAPLAKLVTDIDARRVRSFLTGQANVLLAGPHVELGEQRLLLLNPEVSKWDWLFRRGPQQRFVQAVDVTAYGQAFVMANVHTTNRPEQALRELERAAGFVADAECCVLSGDFNVRRHTVEGYSPPIDGVDQIVVRGLELERGPEAWPRERRTVDGAVLSDHAPVEAVIA
jgi:endonuclease/exonuclease/phosphatase family metal-dependent hydrolase